MLHQIVSSRSECCPLVVEDFVHESTAVIQSFVKSLYTGRVEVTSDNVESLKSLYRSAKLEKFVDAIDNFMIYNNITKCIPAFETGKNSVEVQENYAAHSRDGTISLNSFNALHSVHSKIGLVEGEFQLNQMINSAVDMVSINSEIDRGNSEKIHKSDSHASDRSNVDDSTQDQDIESSSHQLLKPTQCFKILRSSNVSSLSDDDDGKPQGNFDFNTKMTFFDLDATQNYTCQKQGNDSQPDQGNCRVVENQESQRSEIKHITSTLTAVKKEDSDHNSVFHDKNAVLFEAESCEEVKQAPVGKMATERKRKRNDEIQEKLKIPCKKGSATKPRRKQADIKRPWKVRKTSNIPDHMVFSTGSSGGCWPKKSGDKNMPSVILGNVESFDMNREVKVEVTRQAPDDVGKMDDTQHVLREEKSAETCEMSLKDGSISEMERCELMDKSVPETETCESKGKSVPETCETSLNDRSIAKTETCESKDKSVAETETETKDKSIAETFKTTLKDKSSTAKKARTKTQNSTKRARKDKCAGSKSSRKDKFTSVNKKEKKLTATDTLGNGMISEVNKTSAEDSTYSENPLLHEIYLRSNRLSPVWLKHKHYARICGYCDKQEADCQCTPAVGGQKHKCLFCPR